MEIMGRGGSGVGGLGGDRGGADLLKQVKTSLELLDKIKNRLAVRGPAGEHLSLLAGTETLEEIRQIIIWLALRCPADQNHPHCPFRIMSGLTPNSEKNLVNKLSLEECRGLFNMELECRSQTDVPCQSTVKPPPA